MNKVRANNVPDVVVIAVTVAAAAAPEVEEVLQEVLPEMFRAPAPALVPLKPPAVSLEAKATLPPTTSPNSN